MKTPLHLIEPGTGKIFSKSRGRIGNGLREVKGTKNSRSYRQLSFNRKKTLNHRYIFENYWRITLGPDEQVDHKNGNKEDNRISNLRLLSNTQNNQNKGRRRDSATLYKGVTPHKDGTFSAKITVNGNVIKQGDFSTAEEAAKCYDYYAKFANSAVNTCFQLNFE